MAGEIQVSGNFSGTGLITSGSQIVTAPSTTSAAGLNVPLGTAPTTPVAGDLFTDTTRKNLGICGIAGGTPVWLQGCVQTQGTQPMIAFGAPGAQTICSFNTLNAGIINSVGKRLIVTGSGIFTSAVAETPTISLDLFLITKKVVSIPSDAVTASLTNAPFWFHMELLTIAISTGINGTVLGTGIMHMTTDSGVIKTYIYSPAVPTINIQIESAGAPLLQANVGGTALTGGIIINEASLHITN